MATSWTDVGYSPSARVTTSTKVRAIHINELKTAIDAERARRSAGVYTWSDLPVTADVTKGRTAHVNQLRAASTSPLGWCPSDSTVTPAWTDSSITADSTFIRAVHVNELRAYVNTLENVSCLCNCNGYCGCNGQGCGDNSSKRFKENIKLWV